MLYYTKATYLLSVSFSVNGEHAGISTRRMQVRLLLDTQTGQRLHKTLRGNRDTAFFGVQSPVSIVWCNSGKHAVLVTEVNAGSSPVRYARNKDTFSNLLKILWEKFKYLVKCVCGGMADTSVLGTDAERREGSSPF